MKTKAYVKNISAMMIFATIGIFVRVIPISSSALALARTVLGSGFLILVIFITRHKINWQSLKKNLKLLVPAGTIMGFNWVALFEAYKNTTVSVSTLIYYCAPVIVILLSPIVLKEKLTLQKIIGVAAAMLGMVLINGAPIGGANPLRGVLCAGAAAVMYACVVMLNKRVKNVSDLETTLVQLLTAAAMLFIYNLFTLKEGFIMPTGVGLSALLVVGLLHTGFAYFLYFSSAKELAGQSLALCSFVDPFFALIFSATFLGERMTIIQIIGTALVLGGAAFGELYKSKLAHEKAPA